MLVSTSFFTLEVSGFTEHVFWLHTFTIFHKFRHYKSVIQWCPLWRKEAHILHRFIFSWDSLAETTNWRVTSSILLAGLFHFAHTEPKPFALNQLPTLSNHETSGQNPDARILKKNREIRQHWICAPWWQTRAGRLPHLGHSPGVWAHLSQWPLVTGEVAGGHKELTSAGQRPAAAALFSDKDSWLHYNMSYWMRAITFSKLDTGHYELFSKWPGLSLCRVLTETQLL